MHIRGFSSFIAEFRGHFGGTPLVCNPLGPSFVLISIRGGIPRKGGYRNLRGSLGIWVTWRGLEAGIGLLLTEHRLKVGTHWERAFGPTGRAKANESQPKAGPGARDRTGGPGEEVGSIPVCPPARLHPLPPLSGRGTYLCLPLPPYGAYKGGIRRL